MAALPRNTRPPWRGIGGRLAAESVAGSAGIRTQAFGEIAVEDWQAAHLLKPSAVKPVIATLEHSLILKTLG